jgi:hypothetical protein
MEGKGEIPKISREYPYYPEEYGLDLSEVKVGFFGDVPSGSGKEVHAEMDKNADGAWIKIDDKKNEFMMGLLVRDGVMSGDLYTRKKTGETHPDFRAAEFVTWALHRFEQEGTPVNSIESRWVDTRSSNWDSANFKKYKELVEKGEKQREAASQTWSGKLFLQLGFTEIDVPVEKNGIIIARFKKPLINQ